MHFSTAGPCRSRPVVAAYTIGQDADVRITFATRTFADEMQALEHLASVDWPLGLQAPRRRAMAIKLWRLNVLPAVLLRPEAVEWSEQDLAALGRVASWLRLLSGDAEKSLSRAEHRIVAVAGTTDRDAVARSVAEVRAATPVDRAFAADLRFTLARDALLRRMLRLRLTR
ncbi:hypothetical protein NKG05_20850 [Oerskovia sp. M15]